MSAGRLPRPPRPPSLATRKKAFVAEVIDLALAHGLVAQCGGAGEGPGYVLTPLGEAWLRDFPDELLACYPDRRESGGRT